MSTISTQPGKVNRPYTPTWKYEKLQGSRNRLKTKVEEQETQIAELREKLRSAVAIIAALESMNFSPTQPAGVIGRLRQLKTRLS